MKVHAFPAALLASVLALGSASALAHDNKTQASGGAFGQPVAEAPASAKVVDVTNANTLNVYRGDVVTFRNGASAFTWKFDPKNHGRVALKTIAPADFKAPDVMIYVARSESERG